jgi:hypothetical protein
MAGSGQVGGARSLTVIFGGLVRSLNLASFARFVPLTQFMRQRVDPASVVRLDISVRFNS